MTTDTTTRAILTPHELQLPSGSGPRVTIRTRIFRVLRHVVMITFVIVSLYPILWMLVSSLRPDGYIFNNPSLVLDTFEISNYTEGWDAFGAPFSLYLGNSAIIVVGSIIGNLLTCSMAAYAFSRLRFRFRTPAFVFMLLMLMIPVHVVIVPQYVIWAQLDAINSFWPLIVPKFLATDSFFIFLMVQFIRGIPKELDEAARLDGAGHIRIFFQIILPLMVPALATTAIFTFIWTWNDFFSQLIYLTDPDLYTVPLALRAFIDAQGQSSFGSMFAMSVVSVVPLILAFAFGQKYLVRGIATTGGK